MKQSSQQRLLVFGLVISVFSLSLPTSVFAATCSSTSACSAQLKELQKKLTSNQQQIEQKQQVATDLQSAIGNLDSKISSTTEQINNTNEQIDTTNNLIDSLNKDISENTQKLNDLSGKLNNAYVNLYEISQTPTIEILFTSTSLSDFMTQMQYMQSVENSLTDTIDLATKLQNDLNSNKADLEKQKSNLLALQDNLNASKRSLAGQKKQKNYLLTATKDQISTYISDQSTIKSQIADVEKKLASLISQANWGSDIVSAIDGSWYYSQLNYYDTLGDSYYTVHDYGCLITSMAMVATYYGHRTTPPAIAGHDGWFDSQGYANITSIADGIGLSMTQRSAINWSVVDSELSNGHPVIISLYMPRVGAINSDGSSHFVVIKAKVGNKYLMHDPLGDNRSYSLSNARSMLIFRSQ